MLGTVYGFGKPIKVDESFVCVRMVFTQFDLMNCRTESKDSFSWADKTILSFLGDLQEYEIEKATSARM